MARVLTLEQDAQATLDDCARRLSEGGLVALPTETVYGLGADASNDQAVAGIFAAKGRPADHPLIVHVAEPADAIRFAGELPDMAQALMEAFWPGPLTLIVPRRPGVAQAAAGGHDTIGLRCPAHPVAQALLKACARQGVWGVAAPSANRFGRVSPTTAAHVDGEFDDGVWVLDGGPCSVGIESTIVDCTRAQPVLLRPGQISRDDIAKVLAAQVADRDAQAPKASGTLEAHYAPNAKVVLFDADQRQALLDAGTRHGARLGVYSRSVTAPATAHHRQMPGTAEATAFELFAVLRELDASGVDTIWVERPPLDAAWDGVRDRLQRAAAA
jgi:L-threonylcarbamoyladenylate synthase